MEVYVNLSSSACDLLGFLFWLHRHLQVCEEWSKPGAAVRLAVEEDLHIWVNVLNAGLDLKSRGNSILQTMFSYCFHFTSRMQSHINHRLITEWDLAEKIMPFIRGMGLYNCCSFDLVFGPELECEAAWQHLHPAALSATCCSRPAAAKHTYKGIFPRCCLQWLKGKKIHWWKWLGSEFNHS